MERASTGSELRLHAAVAAVYVALAVAITWPLVLRLGDAVPNDPGDPLAFVWVLWWNAQHLPLTDAWLHAPIFFPSPGAIVYQDSLVGTWPLAAPLQWAGLPPLAVHNLLLVLSFALSAHAAWWFCRRLTGSGPAAFVAGLAFGFAPYRAVQLAHVNVLLVFWLPLVLGALHAFLASRRRAWLVAAAGCWVMQGLTTGYFLLYSIPLIAAWAAYFLRSRVRDHVAVAATFAAGVAILWPWLSLYRTVHAQQGFERELEEVTRFSADLSGLWKASPQLALWGEWLGDARHEEQLFPGAALIVLVTAAVVRSRYWAGARLGRVSSWCVGIALLAVTAALIAAAAPIDTRVAGIKLALTRPFKPLGIAWVALLGAVLFSGPVRRAIANGSAPAFYALAAIAFGVLCLGPAPRLFGDRIWYQAPYAWLMLLPGFDAVRVPARMWLIVVLCLSAVAAHGLSRVVATSRARGALVVAAAVAVLADGWLRGVALWPVPAPRAILEDRPSPAAVLELPLGAVHDETAAMYRATQHRAPILNGYSAHFPRSYLMLRNALSHDDERALVPFLERSAVDVVVDARDPQSARWHALVARLGGTRARLAPDALLLHLPARSAAAPRAASPEVPLVSARTDAGRDVLARLRDGRRHTFIEAHPDRPAPVRRLVVQLRAPCLVDELVLDAMTLPPTLRVFARDAVGALVEIWTGSTGEAGVRAALQVPPAAARLPLVATRTRELQLDFGPTDAATAWLLSEIAVRGAACGVIRDPSRGGA